MICIRARITWPKGLGPGFVDDEYFNSAPPMAISKSVLRTRFSMRPNRVCDAHCFRSMNHFMGGRFSEIAFMEIFPFARLIFLLHPKNFLRNSRHRSRKNVCTNPPLC